MHRLGKLSISERNSFWKSWAKRFKACCSFPCLVWKQFLPVTVRLISGGSELLLRLGVRVKLDIAVCSGKRKSHIGQCEWGMVTRNKKNRSVLPLPPTASGCAKSEEYFANVRNCDLEVAATHLDIEDIDEIKEVSVSRQDRRKNRTNAISGDIGKLKDMLSGYLTKAVNTFSRDTNTERRKCLNIWMDWGN